MHQVLRQGGFADSDRSNEPVKCDLLQPSYCDRAENKTMYTVQLNAASSNSQGQLKKVRQGGRLKSTMSRDAG